VTAGDDLPPRHQDLIADFLAHLTASGQSLTALVPKPTTTPALLAVARKWPG
jgi:hypothetical protein